MPRRIIHIIILCSAVCLFEAFTVSKGMDQCLKKVYEIFKKMYGGLPKDGSVVYVNYELITILRPQKKMENETISSSNIKIYSSEKQYRFFSKDIIVYQDEKYTFTIIPSRRIVYWGNAAIDKNTRKRLNSAQSLQDTLFHHYEKVECSVLNTNGNKSKLVKLFPHKQWAQLTQVDHVDFIINDDGSRLFSEKIIYTSGKKLKSVEYIFHDVDYDHKKINMNTTAQSNVFDTNNNLLSVYSGYEVIDVRNKNKNNSKN